MERSVAGVKPARHDLPEAPAGRPSILAEQGIAVALKQAFLLAERLASAPFNVVQLAFIQAECCDYFPVINAL